MNEVEKRGQLAAQSILENESLTEGLDDASGEALLRWGVACAQAVTAESADMEEVEATELIEGRLRALRRLLKAASRWLQALAENDSASAIDQLQKVLEYAQVFYPKNFSPPRPEQLESLNALPDSPPMLINRLRALLEPTSSSSDRSAE